MSAIAIIREILSLKEIRECVDLLRRAFGTVAGEFGLTEESAPTNAAFTTLENLRRHREAGLTLHGMFSAASLVGCIATKRSKADRNAFSIERLAVAPEWRHKGCGGQLLAFAIKLIHASGGRTASIGLMDNNERLKDWYRSKGFVQHDCRKFEHLQFKVCFMSMDLQEGDHAENISNLVDP